MSITRGLSSFKFSISCKWNFSVNILHMNRHWHGFLLFFFNVLSHISTITVFCVVLKVSTSPLSPLQFELFIWSTTRQRQTPTFRSGTWPSWSWAATGAIWTGPYSCASGKPLTGLIFGHPYLHRPFCLSLNLFCLCLADARSDKILPFDVFSRFFFFFFSDTWLNTSLTSGSEPVP